MVWIKMLKNIKHKEYIDVLFKKIWLMKIIQSKLHKIGT